MEEAGGRSWRMLAEIKQMGVKTAQGNAGQPEPDWGCFSLILQLNLFDGQMLELLFFLNAGAEGRTSNGHVQGVCGLSSAFLTGPAVCGVMDPEARGPSQYSVVDRSVTTAHVTTVC